MSDRLSGGAEVGEYLSIEPYPDGIEISDAPGGGAFVDMPGEREEAPPPDEGFYSNLAALLPDHIKDRITTDLLRRIEEDRESRKKRDEQYEEGIRRTGLGNDAPGGAGFEGASKAVHPGMIEACIDYESRMIKELFPPSGPVKAKILGEVTPEKTERAKRKADHMNWQITSQIREARAVLETTLMQVPLGGSQYIHQYWDHRLSRPKWEFRSVDKMLIPFGAADFASATRRTYVDTISQVEYQRRIETGMYLDAKLPSPSMMTEETKSEKASRKVEGAERPEENLDGDRTIYETMVIMEVTADIADALDAGEKKREVAGGLYPYLITTDETSKKMLSMYRDWEDGDKAHEPIEHDFEFPFIPWRGGLAIGFPQIIGSLSAAATGALRALLDSAHVNNAFGGLILKGAGVSGQTVRGAIGEFAMVDAGLETDDIRKRVMPWSPSAPSPVLFQLLGFLVEAQKSVIRTSMDDTPINGAAPVPVGTQMSRVEEGLVVFSAIHGRGHAAMDRLLAGLHRLNRLYLPETLKVSADSREIMIRRKDYEGPCDIQPVSNPTIYSDQQRFAQLAYIQSRVAAMPQLWKIREVELAGLKLIKWPDPDGLLQDIPEPEEMNAVSENLAMTLGHPVKVFPDQNHLAHISTLIDYMKSPALGSNPMIAPIYLPAAIKHAAQHIAYLYVQTSIRQVERAAERTIGDLMSNDLAVKAELDRLLAIASTPVVAEVEQVLQSAAPVIQQAMAMIKALTPPPPIDPGNAAVQAAAAETARRGASDQAANQLGAAKLQSDTALRQQQNAIDADRVAAMREGQQIAARTKVVTTTDDNRTALDIADMKVESGSATQFSNGESLRGT